MAEEGEDFAAEDVEGEAVNCFEGAEYFGQILNLNRDLKYI